MKSRLMKWLIPTQLKKPNACAKNLIVLVSVLYFASLTDKVSEAFEACAATKRPGWLSW